MRESRAASIVAVALAIAACGKSSGGGGPGNGLETVSLPNVDLKADVPVGSKISSQQSGNGHSIMLPPPSSRSLTIETHSDRPKTVAAAVPYYSTPGNENVAGVELPDGWLVTYEMAGTDGKTRFYYLHGARKFEEWTYTCAVTVTSEAERKTLTDICRSLRR